jgi:glycerophosphoryl diester phosphodiesterase
MVHFALLVLTAAAALSEPRVLLDAHNCYPYDGKYADRIERALATGIPVAIEQDLAWTGDHSVLSHEVKTTGKEPLMRDYFFERIRPLVEKELKEKRYKKDWPLIVLNLDFKTNEPEHHREVWKLLGEYEPWLTTARKSDKVSKLKIKPVLVLTGSADVQEKIYSEEVPSGGKLRLFGSVAVKPGQLPGKATNYRRWWNNPWAVVEEGGQRKAGDWTAADRTRLDMLVKHAHGNGLWIRFYTLNGHTASGEEEGWFSGYNFGSSEAAQIRWKACLEAGVDFVATDQYEDFSRFAKSGK